MRSGTSDGNGSGAVGSQANIVAWGATGPGRRREPHIPGRSLSSRAAVCRFLAGDDAEDFLSHTAASKHLYTSLGFVTSKVEMFRRGE